MCINDSLRLSSGRRDSDTQTDARAGPQSPGPAQCTAFCGRGTSKHRELEATPNQSCVITNRVARALSEGTVDRLCGTKTQHHIWTRGKIGAAKLALLSRRTPTFRHGAEAPSGL